MINRRPYRYTSELPADAAAVKAARKKAAIARLKALIAGRPYKEQAMPLGVPDPLKDNE